MGAERYQPESRRRKWTVEEYLQFDAQAEWRYEFIDGRVTPVGHPNFQIDPDDDWDSPHIRAMSGASKEHLCITFDIGLALGAQLSGSSCEPFGTDVRVRLNEAGRYAYPDFTAACGPEFESGGAGTLLNPIVVIEVLSPSTQHQDHTDKWALYQTLPSLQDYLMISTHSPRIEWYSRRAEAGPGAWFYNEVEGLDAVIQLPSINATLSLRDVYERVNFHPSGDNQ